MVSHKAANKISITKSQALNPEEIFTQSIKAGWLYNAGVTLDVLRLDVIHPIVSGNKWFKLKHYVADAIAQQKNTIATFGGAFSNHIIATAFACKQAGLKSVGFIRGDVADNPSPTLKYAATLGMQLIYTDREAYRNKQLLFAQSAKPDWYFIDEGGYGSLGAHGAAEILNYASDEYTHILASTGTGTMLAGLIMGAGKGQIVTGISSMKGNDSLEQAVKHLLPYDKAAVPFTIVHDYHFGGYAKHPAALIAFMNEAWRQFQLPLDIVYTSKLFFGTMDLVAKNHFAAGSKILMIHSGGLQGNLSLPNNQLSFS